MNQPQSTSTQGPVCPATPNWLRGDYFARHLLGSSSETIDIVELNREKEQTGDKKPR